MCARAHVFVGSRKAELEITQSRVISIFLFPLFKHQSLIRKVYITTSCGYICMFDLKRKVDYHENRPQKCHFNTGGRFQFRFLQTLTLT